MKSKTLGEELREHWLSQHIKIKVGITEESLSKFELLYKVLLPQDFREYFLLVNGMVEGATDEDLIRFWPLEDLKPLPKEAPAYSTPAYLPEAASFFVFADYSLWAHAYAIRLSNNHLEPDTVFVIGGVKAIQIADSFSNFVSLYLAGKSLDFKDN